MESSTDYLALIAPLPFLMTRGLYEIENEEASKRHVMKTKKIENDVRKYYEKLNASERFKAIYFEGSHDFPPEIHESVYKWLDSYLKQGS
ncbi:MAG: hypothetical protein ACE5NG_12995 [bacterium]